MVTFVDPVLDRLSEIDPDAYRAVIAEVGDVLDVAESMAGDSGLSLNDMTTLSTHFSADVRSVVASRPDCPAEMVHALASDPNVWVRCAVARRGDVGELGLWEQLASDSKAEVQRAIANNPACPQTVLLQLAITAEYDVQMELWRNPALTEEVRAALVLAGTKAPDDYRIIQAWRTSGVLPTDRKQLEALAGHRHLDADALREILQAVGDEFHAYAIRSKLAEHPAADEALLAQLVHNAKHRWEWRSLWQRYFPMPFPSTAAMSSARTSDATRTALNAAGHPAGLISIDLPAVACSVNPAEGLAQLIRSELLVGALWRELALTGVLPIEAQNDNHDGNKFYLSITGNEGDGPIGYLLGGYSQNREWAEIQDSLDEEDAQHALSQWADDWDFEEESDDEAMCVFISYAALNTTDLTITEKGAAFILEVALGMDVDTEYMESTVTIKESKLPHIGYGGLDPLKKAMLADLLMASREHVLMREWGLADHLLSCVEHHLDTPEDLRIRIVASRSEKDD
jgi:hypothetical protein